MKIAFSALVVRDYDEAISFFVDILGFTLTEDTDLGNGKRWVCVMPPDSESGLLLALPVDDEQRASIGHACGGRVSFFLYVDDFEAQYQHMRSNGVCFLEEPRHESYGIVAVFKDLYGNKWDLIEPV